MEVSTGCPAGWQFTPCLSVSPFTQVGLPPDICFYEKEMSELNFRDHNHQATVRHSPRCLCPGECSSVHAKLIKFFPPGEHGDGVGDIPGASGTRSLQGPGLLHLDSGET